MLASASERDVIDIQKEARMQGKKLYVGNLNYSVTNEQLKELFSNYGEVLNVNLIEGKNFGFVELSSQSEAEKAKDSLNGTEFEGRTLRVNEARPQARKQKRDFRRY
jgi:RNA recognition motif-containing protein